MSSPPPSSAAARHQPVPPKPTHDDNYSKIESDVYSEPFSPPKEGTSNRERDVSGFHLSKNESYGSLPSAPQPHYATPTSTLRYIPESNVAAIFDVDEYEPMMLQPHTATHDLR